MKKILAWVLVLVLVVGMLAGCGCQPRVEDPTEPSQEAPEFIPEGATAEEAMKYLRAIYKDTEEPTPTPVNYDRYGIVRIAGIPFTVVWTVDVSEDLIKIIVNEDGSVTIDVNEACEVATPYTLTATITDEYGNTASHSWDMILPAAVDMVEIVKTAYELESGESLPYQSTLRGKITAINTVYSAEYKNITVTIVVEGAEDMPIMCYRLKGDGIDKLLVGNIITVTGTLKNYNGTIEFDAGCTLDAVEEGDAVEAITDPGEILKAAYALKEDAQLPNPATLTGTVIEIDSPYDPNYGNISVVIEVEGYPQYPILCYRMKGVDVSKIAVNDLITVTGIIKNYKGTIEFDAGCQMTDRISGGGVAQGPSSDQNKILSDANKLAVGEKLPYIATLTGEIYSVDTPYDATYGNVTVTMLVGGQKIQCFRMIGDGVDQIRETDTITVTGIIENYNGKLEFGAKCNLDSWTKGPRNVNYGSLKEETAYRLYVKQTALEKTLYFTGDYSGSRLSTSTLGSEGVDVFVERVSGKGLRFYFMDGETKTYIGVEDYTNTEGKVRGRTVVGADVVSYWTYDSTLGVYVSTVQAGKHFLGTYGTYETISASWTGYIDGTMSGSNQYIAKFMLASDVPADDAPALAYGTYTTTPEVGVAYKLGLDQTTKEATYYFTGTMSGYYGATEADYSKGVDVYLEEADGGYYLYFMDGSTKQYVYIVANGTHMNFTYTTSNKSVFTYDTELNSLYTTVDGAVYYMGTYGSYVTVGTTSESNAPTSYVTHLYTSGTGGGNSGDDNTGDDNTGDDNTGDNTTTGDVTVVDTPAVDTAYKFGMIQENVSTTDVYYLAGGMSGYYMATGTDVTAAIDVYLEETEGGYYLYTLVDGTKTYINMVVSGTYVNGAYETTASTVYTYDAEAKTVIAEVNGTDYWFGTRNDKTYTTVGPVKVEYNGFYMQFYTASEGDDSTTDEATAYTFGMIQENVSTTDVYYLIGGMNGYYMATGTDATAAIQVYMEETEGGCYLYTMIDGTKTYINMVVSGTHVNGAYEATASTVYTYDAEKNTVIAEVNGADYWFGTRNDKTYTTVGPVKVEYEGFYCKFYPVTEGDDNTGDDNTGDDNTGDDTVTAPTVVDTPAVDTAYKFGMIQENVSATDVYYLIGGMNGYYMATGTDTTASIDVYLEETDGGYYMYTLVDGTKTYINMVVSGTHVNGAYEATASTVYTYDAEAKTVIAEVDGADYWFGTRNDKSYTTVGPVKVEYEGFYMQFYTVPESDDTTGDDNTGDDTTGGETATAYKFGMIQENVSTTDVYYLVGGMSGYYMATGTDVTAAIDVYMEETDGGYYLYTMIDGTKTYINMVVSGTYVNGAYETTASTVYTYDTEKNTVIAQVNGTDYWFGTRNDKSYTTVGPVKVEYDGFYMQFYPVTEGDDSTTDEATAYTFGMIQENVSTTDVYYLAGGMSGYYMATTTDVTAAIQVYMEETDGGCYLYTMVDGTKTYINMVVSGTYVNGAYETTASTVYTYDAEKNTVIAQVNGTDYWFGTRNDKSYTTVGPVKVEYDGFYMQFYPVTEGDDSTGDEETPVYTEMTIAEARDAETGTLVQVSGVVARLTYSYGPTPSGVILVDETSSIYVYDKTLAANCTIGNTVTVSASKAYWILETEQTNAATYGYKGCNQLESVQSYEVDSSVTAFPKSWIEETTVKEILDTPVSEDITTKIYKVTALINKVEGTGFTNYYINDLDGTTGTYSYSQCSGADYAWLDEFDGKVCTVYVTALNAKSAASGCTWRFLPVEVVDEGFDASTVNFAENAVKYYGLDQFQSYYSGDPAAELLSTVDNELLGYTGAVLTYTSSDPSVASIDENVLHCHKTGTVTVTVTGTYGEQSYSEDVTIEVEIIDLSAEYPTVADVIATAVDTTVTVKAIVGPSLVNQDGFYLIDETGVIAVLTDTATLETLSVGDLVILEGTRYYKTKSGATLGNTCIKDAVILANGYGNHAYSTASFDGTLTLAEFKALDVNTDYTTSVYTVTATVEVVETAYYTSIKLVDGDTSVNLYSSSAGQYSWLQEYAGQEITMELAPCNWSAKSTYPACVLAVLHDDGTKTVNTLNFN